MRRQSAGGAPAGGPAGIADNDTHVVAALRKREMQVEHSINLVRSGVFGFGVVADVVSAATGGFVTGGYLLFIFSAVVFALAYLGAVHMLSLPGRYRGWLKYVTITVDCLLPVVFMAEMLGPQFAGRIDMESVVSINVVMVVIIIMLNALRLSTASVAYCTLLGAAIVAASELLVSREPFVRIWMGPLVVAAGLITYWVSLNVRRLIRDLRRRERLARFLPRDLVALVEDSNLEVTLGGREERVTVLFADIRGFTRYSEDREPLDVVGVLNEYFSVMSAVIQRHGGMIDKFIGDAIMAVFGAPFRKGDDAERAVAAAGDMLEELDRLNHRWARVGRPAFAIGIALNTGTAVTGTIGAPDRMDYTVIGDSVNLASRLEELNKTYGTQLIMSEETRREAHGAGDARFLGEVSIRGREKPVRIYTLEGRAPAGRGPAGGQHE